MNLSLLRGNRVPDSVFPGRKGAVFDRGNSRETARPLRFVPDVKSRTYQERNAMRIRTKGARAALLLALALAVGGCGSDDGGETVGAVAQSAEARDEQAVKFAECLREHGVEVADPEEGKGIRITGRLPKSKVDAAMEACREYNPMQEGASQDPEIEERMRKMARCMRDNGVEEFPDPEPGKGIQLTGPVVEDPDFEKAEKACERYGPGGGEKSDNTDGNG
ncbi:hypothetical protein OG864_14020 [Streptomyces sp. NBC_00124]|uniref:hypothetical protein n=1 Tax=Streptomyces sp. NBC_00124 TaxID=2975662 RepID=UPI002256143D|nr:hypothetical protein [Streptomyces sp. NBC_00124]MCX5359817.1 hypothetical protein [Streptomyces sp. NBC_00124]